MSFAGAKGLDGVCITDHDTMAVRQVFREGVQDNGLCVIFGLEYATGEGDFLLFGPFEEIRPRLSAAELLRYVEDSGGVAVAAHPCRRTRSTRENLIREHLCRIVESVNGRNSRPENEQAASWCKRYNVSQVSGSDAHSLAELGMAVTRFHEPIHSRSDLIRSLKNGSFTAERSTAAAAVLGHPAGRRGEDRKTRLFSNNATSSACCVEYHLKPSRIQDTKNL